MPVTEKILEANGASEAYLAPLRNAVTTLDKINVCAIENSEHPESNQGPFDTRKLYSRTLYQLSYVRWHAL